MNNGVFAKEQIVEDYLTSLLTEEAPKDVIQSESVAKLLKSANLRDVDVDKIVETPAVTPDKIAIKETVLQVDIEEAGNASQTATVSHIPTGDFQALFFKVAGLTLALPLTELGGIHKIEKIGPLFGKPDWFKGVMLHRDENLNVVDTAKWVMPEKYDEKLAESLKYQYLIMLDSSGWGLACESLVTTATLKPADVKWREDSSKRQWLAGMVKEKMCALVNVKQLIALLDKGLGSNSK
ncbi:chemotaxis protein CheW [Aliiglaciecola sp. LCG003]|uniref:chemotaxis protein CheW n=1 Tax=Aliiglaciecola sp. LCG003 TaxID=3053655 RepID=UPI0025742DFC|nr:chemotaxis protein CheW [Aliiglaciecola sp. LCG003]WJG08389.1 chemotaxis protein CheW [Aliiglaciecola sp. LCG003]